MVCKQDQKPDRKGNQIEIRYADDLLAGGIGYLSSKTNEPRLVLGYAADFNLDYLLLDKGLVIPTEEEYACPVARPS